MTIQSIDSIEIYAYGARKYLIFKNKKLKYDNIIRQCNKFS